MMSLRPGTVLLLLPSFPYSVPEEVILTRAGPGWSHSGTTGTVDCNYTHVGLRTLVSFPRHGPVLLTTIPIGVIHHFLGQLMHNPTDGFDPTIPSLRIYLRGSLRGVEEGILRVDDNPELDYSVWIVPLSIVRILVFKISRRFKDFLKP